MSRHIVVFKRYNDVSMDGDMSTMYMVPPKAATGTGDGHLLEQGMRYHTYSSTSMQLLYGFGLACSSY
jgi:hypothetical protein